MKRLLCVCAALWLSLQVTLVQAADTYTPKVYGEKGYVWNEMTPERAAVLKMKGDVARGKEAFRGCQGCHKSDGAGVREGVYPRLSGQHVSVLIKQITEIRAGIRQNPKMLPFVQEPAISTEEIADIAVFLNSVTSVRENGKGPGDQVERGKEVYFANKCHVCHGKNGEGDADKAYPALAAQHYNYLLREMKLIETGARGNSHPDMVKAISRVSQSDREAVADFLSRLPDYRTIK